MISCSTSSLLYARDSLRARQTYRMPVKSIASLLIKLYVRQIQNTSNRDWVTRIFLVDVYVFDLLQSEIYTSSLLKMRLIRGRVIVMKYSYEYNESSILTIDNRTGWFFRLDVLETIYDEEICIAECQDHIWSIYSSWSCCIQDSFTKSTDSNQLLEALSQKASATVLVQEWYSYEADANDLNWLSFKVTASWLKIWDETALSSAKTLLWIDFSIATDHAKFLATTLRDNVSKTRREKLIDAIACCLLSTSLYELVWRWSGRSFAVRL